MNFPFICSNIPAAPVYGVYISQLIRYSWACGFYHDFLDRGLLLTRNLLNQWSLVVKLKSSFRKSPPWPNDHGYVPYVVIKIRSSFMTYHRVCKSNTTGTTCGSGTAHPFRSTWVQPRFLGGFVLLNLNLFSVECFCRSLFVLLSFFVWP